MVGKYWFETFGARCRWNPMWRRELRYRDPPLEGGAAVVVSQSGETADTLAALRDAKAKGQHRLSVVNVATSTIARESDIVRRPGRPGNRRRLDQGLHLPIVGARLSRHRGRPRARHPRCGDRAALVAELIAVPGLMAEAARREAAIETLARDLAKARDVLYLGRGTSYPLALEGALKLKEISYIHAEGYAAGELKHGPIALIDEDMPVIVVAPFDPVFEKTVSNMQEVAARGGRIIIIADARAELESAIAFHAVVAMPEMAPAFAAIVYAVPVQLIAYHTAVFMGKDVDQPRNLAKSVTVE